MLHVVYKKSCFPIKIPAILSSPRLLSNLNLFVSLSVSADLAHGDCTGNPVSTGHGPPSTILHLIPLVLLCISGLFANLIQAICFVCIWPISKSTYRKINRVVKELDWWVLVCLIDWWEGVKVYIKRHAAKELPETDDAVEKWCTDIFAVKVVIFSACLLVFGSLKFNLVHCSTLLVFSAALFFGRMLALFGCGVLSQLQCSDPCKPI